jgi:hypothetical protein
MERLTKWNELSHKHAYYPRCFEEPRYGSGCKIKDCPFETAVCERLAAYEDTGLTPERCAEFARADAEGRYIVMRDAEQEGVARLRELAEADKDGRVVVLPCKVGDTVFARLDNKSKYVCECKVKQIVVGNIGFVTFAPIGAPEREYDVSLRGFGKTVFLTREEAEKALAEMEGKKDG